jgi:DNA-binding response OmpR family regulator
MAKVLVVEDDKNLCRIITDLLGFEQFVIEVVHDGLEAADRLKLYHYDLIILDWELPKLSGVEVCRRFRSASGKSPVLMLTGKAQITEKESGFEAGADDYLTKPFDARELMARIKALLRRSPVFNSTVITLGDLRIDSGAHRFLVAGREVTLLPKEFMLLELLLKNPNQVISQEMLLNTIWSSESESSAFAVRSCVKRLRKKLDECSSKYTVKAVYGVGYRVEERTPGTDSRDEDSP